MVNEIQARAYPIWISNILSQYYKLPNHPSKLRLLTWIEKLLGNKRILIKTNLGFYFTTDRYDYIQKTVFHTRDWEPEIGKVLSNNLKEDDIFYDIGANTGYFSCYALKCGAKKVVAFEPNPDLQQIFILNLKSNYFENNSWNLQCYALSDHNGKSYYQPGSSGNTGLGKLIDIADDNQLEQHYTVTVKSLDSIVFDYFLPPPTVMKLDIEGGEAKVLRGAKKILQHKPPRLIIFEADCNSSWEISDTELVKILQENNYYIKHLPRHPIQKKENFLALKNCD